MKKLAIGAWAFPDMDLHLLVHKLANLGYQGLELGSHPGPETLDTRQKRHTLRKMLADHRLEFSGHAPDLRGQQLWSVEEPTSFLEAFQNTLAFAEDLAITTVCIDTVEPIIRVRELRIDPKLILDRCVKALHACSQMAAQHGITLCWEFAPGLPLNRPGEIVEVIDTVRALGNPNFGALYNTSHAHICSGGKPFALLEQLKGKITHARLIDSVATLEEESAGAQVPFGEGVVDFDRLVPELLANGVKDDWWCVDLPSGPDAWTLAAESRRFLYNALRKYAP